MWRCTWPSCCICLVFIDQINHSISNMNNPCPVLQAKTLDESKIHISWNTCIVVAWSPRNHPLTWQGCLFLFISGLNFPLKVDFLFCLHFSFSPAIYPPQGDKLLVLIEGWPSEDYTRVGLRFLPYVVRRPYNLFWRVLRVDLFFK